MGCARASGAKRPPFTTSSRSNFEGRSPPSPTSFNGQGCYLYSRKKGRPSPREPSAGEGAARRAPRVQRPRRRAPRRRRPSRGRAAGGRVPQAPRRVERPPTCAPGSPRAVTTPSASGAVRPRKGAARPCKRLLLRCAAGSSVSPTARHAARRIIEGLDALRGVVFCVM